jgi:hypothetical protein
MQLQKQLLAFECQSRRYHTLTSNQTNMFCSFIINQTGNYVVYRSDSAVDAATPVDTVDRFSQAINNTVEAVIPRLADFHKLLLSPPKVFKL